MRVIPYGHQYIDEGDIKEVVKALRSDWLTQGPMVKDFEDSLCRSTGARYAVAVSSGTAALHIACLASGIKRDDEVITSAITFAASANCILYCGGKPVFADIRQDTGNIDCADLNKKINARTKAVIPVHFAGQPCDMDEVYSLAKKRGLTVIEDAAHALGAEYKGSKVGSCRYSDMAVFSFHPVKSITTGEGGAVLTNKRNIYEKLIMLRNHGITKKAFLNKPQGSWYYEMQFLGYNYRITDIQAALGSSQLKKLGNFLSRREEIAGLYREAFKRNPYFDLPVEKENVLSSHHLFPIRLKDKYVKNKKVIFDKMKKRGLGVQVHYIPVYLFPYYKKLGFRKGLCPAAENFYKREISIPLYPAMKKVDKGYVIKNIIEVFKEV